METKKAYKSKTMWVNLAALLAALIGIVGGVTFQDALVGFMASLGVVLDPALLSSLVVVFLAVANMVLRKLTTTGITFSGRGFVRGGG